MQAIKTWVGVDVSAKTLASERWRENEDKDKTREFTNDAAGHRELLKWIGKGARVCMEATGIYHLQLALMLVAAGVEVMVINPRVAKDFGRALANRSKTDRVDAWTLLEYVRRMEFVAWRAPSEAVLELRELGRRLSELVQVGADEKNRFHAKKVAAISRTVVKDVEAHVAQIEKRIKQIEKAAAAVIRGDAGLHEQFAILTKIVGVARRSAILLLTELSVLDPTMTVKQIVGHAGLDPREHESGTSVQKSPRISKVGNSRLRAILYMSALTAIRNDRGARLFFAQLVARGKKKKQAIVAVMRKLLHGIWTVLQRRVAFDSSVLFGASLAKAESSDSAVAANQPEPRQDHPKGRSEAEELSSLILPRRRLRAREEKDRKPLDSQQSIFDVLRHFVSCGSLRMTAQAIKRFPELNDERWSDLPPPTPDPPHPATSYTLSTVSLRPGTRLGPYEITSSIGSGGMGEVYRASDTRLARDVAIKVLPAEFAQNAQLRARFEREARAISSLNHPNICMLFDVGSQHEVEYLVMEYLDGESLTERLARGPLAVSDVLRYGIEIADALDKAHRTGIIHRDLKPGNVILTRSGSKLLDFGLAKAMDAALMASTSPHSSTAIHPNEPLTAEGVLVGTFCYMAPEQIEYAKSDVRSDIFAFGCMIYEMLTGRRAFAAASRAGMIAQIIASDPPSISSLRPMTPVALDRVVRTCLAKNPDDRFQTAHDVMLALQWIRDEQSSPSAPMPLARARGRMWGERAAWAMALILAIGAAVGLDMWSRREVANLDRPLIAAIVPPRGLRFVFTGDYAGSPVLSPDGRRVAFVAVSPDGQRTLWVRALDAADPREVESSDDAMFPFWSPDNRFLGFFAHGKLKTVDAGGGVPIVIADAPNSRGGTWSDQNVIVYTPETRAGLFRVAANGGSPVALTTPSGGMTTHRWPLFLPGGKSFLYLAANHFVPGSPATALHIRSLDGKSDHVVTQTLANVSYVDGRLLMLRDSTLVAQPFDALRGVLTGASSIVAQNVRFDASTWHGVFDAAGRSLIYQPGGAVAGTHLVWFGHDGKNLGALGDVARYYDLELSPDGRRLVTNAGEPRADIWVIDADRNVRTRLTFEGSMNEAPIWSADGNEIIYAARDTPEEKAAIYRRRADGSGPRQLVAKLEGDADPGSVSADGHWVAATLWRGRGASPQIWAVPLVPEGKSHAVIAGEFAAHDPRISPDGRWLAYTSNESGRDEIYVVPFLGGGGKWQVTTAGGHSSRWSPDGTHLDYLTSDNVLTEVDVKSGGGFEIGAARNLFRLDVNPVSSSDYDLARDGRIIANGGEADPSPLTLVANWR